MPHLGMKTLHSAYRVTDLEASLAFYTSLGWEQVGRVDIGGGTSLTMLKFPSDEVVTLELVHGPPTDRLSSARGSAIWWSRSTTSAPRSRC
jgi:catechol 2,3-dioxygenase-like lactoylglutathione lyase family enzyme